ncbi:MAG: ATP-binding protein [Lachnospiraceae bacterium]|nr:ATP-binding protein [Lachnospiraceae bacterium]
MMSVAAGVFRQSRIYREEMFVGRKKELKYLEEHYQKDTSRLLVVYGHKGIGKSSLLFQFAHGRQLFYYAARECSEQEQFRLWMQELERDAQEDTTAVPHFEDVFRHIVNRADPSAGRFLLVIDEFQNIVRYSPYFMEELVRRQKESAVPCMIVLLSSSISFVENTLVPRIGNSALGIHGFLKLPELGFADCVHYFKDCTTRQCMEIYSILGGVPAYWAALSPEKEIRENIISAILCKGAPLKAEAERIVSAELRELHVYNTILYCLANGKNKLNDLHQYTGFSRAKISVYLRNLMERELVEKVFPFENASNLNAMKGIYRISLRFLEFTCRFLFAERSLLETGSAAVFYSRVIAPYLEAFHQSDFRKVCKEYLELLNERKMLPIRAVRSGEWVGKCGTIDIILQDADENSLLAFCEWQKEEVTQTDLDGYLKLAGEARISADHLYLFCAGHFSEGLQAEAKKRGNIALVDMEAL